MNPGYMFGMALEQRTVIGQTKLHQSFKATDQFGGQMMYFSGCILDDRDPEPDGEEGLADVRVLEAILEARRTGQPQHLPAVRARAPHRHRGAAHDAFAAEAARARQRVEPVGEGRRGAEELNHTVAVRRAAFRSGRRFPPTRTRRRRPRRRRAAAPASAGRPSTVRAGSGIGRERRVVGRASRRRGAGRRRPAPRRGRARSSIPSRFSGVRRAWRTNIAVAATAGGARPDASLANPVRSGDDRGLKASRFTC